MRSEKYPNVDFSRINMINSIEEFEIFKGSQKIKLTCNFCNIIFEVTKTDIYARKRGQFCTLNCSYNARRKEELVTCLNCDKKFIKKLKEVKRTPNHFCSSSCSATYNNKHKKHGIRRSKMELYLEEKLKLIYGESVKFTERDISNYEFDIWFPNNKIAIEINGICHYKPIYGEEKYQKILEKDKFKRNFCKENEIEFLAIDISKIQQFKEQLGDSVLVEILEFIDKPPELNSYWLN